MSRAPDARRPARNPSETQPPPRIGLAARRIAADVLGRVLDKGRPLDQELDDKAATTLYQSLIAKDRALVRAIVGTTLRRLGQIDHALSRLIDRPLPEKAARARAILRIGAAQMLFMDVPDHAAVSVAVTLADEDRLGRPWKGLVNGVLRGLARRRDEILSAQDPERLNTPDWLWERWVAAYGEPVARAVARAHMNEPSLDLSVKADAAGWAERLGGFVLPTGTVRTEGGGTVDGLPGYADGAWWVQDAAASLPARLLGDVAGLRVADLCAAPGGKTAELAAAGAVVTAVDLSPDRLARLARNIERLRLSGVTTVAADLTAWSPDAPFDAVLLDAPCSATGTIRRHPDVARLKTPEDVAALAGLQSRLLDRAAGWVKPGGRLVYCTCSLEPEEGEDQIARFLAAHPGFRREPIRPEEIGGLAELVTASGDLRTLPCHLPDPDPKRAGLDGFFAARLVAPGP
ncbi:RsmB/NOP family class I SAM-dependent RNA methyltransferase [Prosthecomicrobium sp. N25]|uniref:RsmB/NOP family class I SAM-dependent RNA methyltransferase n=1 Tax=Prosthecomicrobium sp. N25 TaxID=3129254 RepID=UPI0030785BE3